MSFTHPRHWRAKRIQGRFSWIVSLWQEGGYLVFRRIGWR